MFRVQYNISSVPGKSLPSGNGVGTHDEATDCQTCAAGKYANKHCPRGTGLDRGGNPHPSYNYCRSGRNYASYLNTDSNYWGASVCTQCGGGFYQSNAQSASCSYCIPGRYLPSSQNEYCLWYD